MSAVVQTHRLPHVVEGLTGGLARFLAAFGNDATNELRIVLEFLGALADAGDLLDHLVDERLLAVEAADPCSATAVRGPGIHVLGGVDFVQLPYRAFVGVARI